MSVYKCKMWVCVCKETCWQVCTNVCMNVCMYDWNIHVQGVQCGCVYTCMSVSAVNMMCVRCVRIFECMCKCISVLIKQMESACTVFQHVLRACAGYLQVWRSKRAVNHLKRKAQLSPRMWRTSCPVQGILVHTHQKLTWPAYIEP